MSVLVMLHCRKCLSEHRPLWAEKTTNSGQDGLGHFPTIVLGVPKPLNKVSRTPVARIVTTGFNIAEKPPVFMLMKVNSHITILVAWVDVVIGLQPLAFRQDYVYIIGHDWLFRFLECAKNWKRCSF